MIFLKPFMILSSVVVNCICLFKKTSLLTLENMEFITRSVITISVRGYQKWKNCHKMLVNTTTKVTTAIPC